MTTHWVEAHDFYAHGVGDVGFLVRTTRYRQRGREEYSLASAPPRTNISREPRLFGWCGTTNDVAVHGLGLARVVRVAKNGRAQVVTLDGDEAIAALDSLGWVDLADQMNQAA